MDPWRVLKYPYTTEKTIQLAERENKIVFIVDKKANKEKIKTAFEKVFEVKVQKINTEITFHGDKKAFIKLKPEFKAADVAVKLGII
jgi:large subunit ribosomal protein L23